MLEPDYCEVRLLEIRVGRRLWDSKSYGKDVRDFHVRVVKPLRRLQRRGVVETQGGQTVESAPQLAGRGKGNTRWAGAIPSIGPAGFEPATS